jgi:hypothetical protein
VRRYRTGAATLGLLALVVAGAVSFVPGVDVGSVRETVQGGVTPHQPGLSESVGRGPRVAAVDRLLARQAGAVEARDATAFARTLVDSGSPAGRVEVATFDRMVRMGVTDLTWRTERVDPGESRSTTWVATVTGHYRLRGIDDGVRDFSRLVAVEAAASGWRVVGRWTGPPPGPASPVLEAWDLPGARVVRGEHSVVVGDVPRATLQRYARLADSATADVAGLCGASRPHLVVVAPAAVGELDDLLDGDENDPTQVAAMTLGSRSGEEGRTADRIVVNPDAFARITPLGRRVVLTHEATHVALRATYHGAPAKWLSEGLADVTGYAVSALPVKVVAADLLAEVRRGEGPHRLPADEDFEAAAPDLDATYQAAYLAVHLLRDRHGLSSVCRLYASAGSAGGASGEEATRQAWTEVGGTTRAAFTRSWLAELDRLAR